MTIPFKKCYYLYKLNVHRYNPITMRLLYPIFRAGNKAPRRFVLFLLPIVLFSVVSCSEFYNPSSMNDMKVLPATKAMDNTIPVTDTISNFWELKGITSERIREIEDGDEKLAFCQLSEEECRYLSTRDLAYVCYSYPLAFDVFLCNDEKYGAAFMVSHFNGFQELLYRNDAASAIIDFYASLNPSYIEGQLKESVWERVMATPDVQSRLSAADKLYLLSVIEKKSILRFAYHDFGISQRSLSDLYDVVIQDSKCNESISARSLYFGYTPFGKPIYCETKSEFSTDSIAYFDDLILSNYSNITLLNHSSRQYNCHAYAWLGSTNVWMSDGSYNNVSKFFTNDLYTESQNAPNYKVHYYMGDHSAIQYYTDNHGTYVSKWGEGPLVRHGAANVPSSYQPSYRKYYSAPIMTGPDYLTVGETYTFTVTPYMSYASYDWYIDQGDTKYQIISISDNVLQVKFLVNAIFDVYCDIKTATGTVTVYTVMHETLY